MSFGLNDLSISLGYGIVYQINQDNRIGYEYLSSFPFDRGQMVRLFWLRVLKAFSDINLLLLFLLWFL